MMYDRLAVRLPPPSNMGHGRDIFDIDQKMSKKKKMKHVEAHLFFSANAVAC